MTVRDFIKINGGKYDDQVIEYCQTCIENIQSNTTFKNNFKKYNVSLNEFLNLLLQKTQKKLNQLGSEKLDRTEFDQVFKNVIFYNEMINLINDDHINLSSINIDGKIEYLFDEYSIKLFKEKYNINLRKINLS